MDVAPFLALSPEQQRWVILQGPLRPPSTTTLRLGIAETLALRLRELEPPRPATGPGGAAAVPHVTGHLAPMQGHGQPAPMAGAPYLAAATPAGPFTALWFPAGHDGSGVPLAAAPPTAAAGARMPWL